MPRHRPDFESHLLRKDLVKAYLRQGLSVPEMVKRLDQHGLFDQTQGYNARYSVVARLLRAVQKQDRRRFHVLQEDADRALIEYIERQHFLYARAVADGSYELARRLSQDIAKAHGVPTEEPIKIETDILSQMQAAFAQGEKRLAERRMLEKRSAIEVSLIGNGKGE